MGISTNHTREVETGNVDRDRRPVISNAIVSISAMSNGNGRICESCLHRSCEGAHLGSKVAVADVCMVADWC